MANPITWQNVSGPSIADAAAPLRYAQQMFSAAFDPIQADIKKRQETEAQNWDTGAKNNTAAFLAALRAPQSAAAYADAQKAGTFEALRNSMGAQVDQAAIGNAEDGRMALLQQRDTATNAFNKSMAETRAAPILERIGILAQQGKSDEAKALAASNMDLPGISNALDKLHGVEQRGVTEARATADEAQKRLKDPLEIQSLESKLKTDAAQRGVLAAQASELASRAEDRRNLHSIDAAEKEKEALAAKLRASLTDNRFKDGEYNPAMDATEII